MDSMNHPEYHMPAEVFPPTVNGVQPEEPIRQVMPVAGTDVWCPETEAAFEEAWALFPPSGRRRLLDAVDGKMYGRNDLIARYIERKTGVRRTRKQISSHIQVLARPRARQHQARTGVSLAAPPGAPMAAGAPLAASSISAGASFSAPAGFSGPLFSETCPLQLPGAACQEGLHAPVSYGQPCWNPMQQPGPCAQPNFGQPCDGFMHQPAPVYPGYCYPPPYAGQPV